MKTKTYSFYHGFYRNWQPCRRLLTHGSCLRSRDSKFLKHFKNKTNDQRKTNNMPVRRSAKSLKQLSLEYITQHFGDYYDRYKSACKENNMGRLDVVSPFDPLRKCELFFDLYLMVYLQNYLYIFFNFSSIRIVGGSPQKSLLYVIRLRSNVLNSKTTKIESVFLRG